MALLQEAQIHSEQFQAASPPYLRNKTREIVGSKAFNLEYDASPTREELRQDVIGYLGEYRLEVQKYNYELIFGRDRTGGGSIALRDKDRGEPIRVKAKRNLEERIIKNEPIHREIAEDAGLGSLEDQVQFSQTGDTIIWGSPPGPKEQGYGEYGFLFAGKITRLPQDEAHLALTAIRVEKPTIAQYNACFEQLAKRSFGYQAPEDFLQQPFVLHESFTPDSLDHILKRTFSFEVKQKQQEIFEKVIARMNPMIDDFTQVFYTGTNEEKVKAFHALENYALKLKAEYESFGETEKIVFIDEYRAPLRLNHIVAAYSYAPPIVRGSCGGTGSNGSMRSNNVLSIGSRELTNSMSQAQEWFHCPKCTYQADGPIGNSCPGCGLTKEAYAEESGIVCD